MKDKCAATTRLKLQDWYNLFQKNKSVVLNSVYDVMDAT